MGIGVIRMQDSETISDIKKQLQTIHEQIEAMVSNGEGQEALQSYSQSITTVKLRHIKS